MQTRRLTVTAMGIALFVVFSLALQVPVYQNYYISLGYFVMMVWLYNFGILEGTAVGALGVVLYCVITGGLRGMPGWTLGNLIIGIEIGCMFLGTKHLCENYKQSKDRPGLAIMRFIQVIFIALATVFGILIIKSVTEVILYSQPMLVRMATNLPATIADVITLIAALPVAVYMNRILKSKFPELVWEA